MVEAAGSSEPLSPPLDFSTPRPPSTKIPAARLPPERGRPTRDRSPWKRTPPLSAKEPDASRSVHAEPRVRGPSWVGAPRTPEKGSPDMGHPPPPPPRAGCPAIPGATVPRTRGKEPAGTRDRSGGGPSTPTAKESQIRAPTASRTPLARPPGPAPHRAPAAAAAAASPTATLAARSGSRHLGAHVTWPDGTNAAPRGRGVQSKSPRRGETRKREWAPVPALTLTQQAESKDIPQGRGRATSILSPEQSLSGLPPRTSGNGLCRSRPELEGAQVLSSG